MQLQWRDRQQVRWARERDSERGRWKIITKSIAVTLATRLLHGMIDKIILDNLQEDVAQRMSQIQNQLPKLQIEKEGLSISHSFLPLNISLLLHKITHPGQHLSAMIGSETPGMASSLETGPSEEFFVFQFRLELEIQNLLKNCQRW